MRTDDAQSNSPRTDTLWPAVTGPSTDKQPSRLTDSATDTPADRVDDPATAMDESNAQSDNIYPHPPTLIALAILTEPPAHMAEVT